MEKQAQTLSLGTSGAHFTVYTSGRKTGSVGLPGTESYYTESVGGRKRSYNSKSCANRLAIQQ